MPGKHGRGRRYEIILIEDPNARRPFDCIPICKTGLPGKLPTVVDSGLCRPRTSTLAVQPMPDDDFDEEESE